MIQKPLCTLPRYPMVHQPEWFIIRSFQAVQENQGPSEDHLELFALWRLIPFRLATMQAACWCGWSSGLCLTKAAQGTSLLFGAQKSEACAAKMAIYILTWLPSGLAICVLHE